MRVYQDPLSRAIKVRILRQSRRLSVAGPSKGPDRNRRKAKTTATEAGLINNRLQKSESNSGRYTPGILKVLLPPRQSRGISLGIRNNHKANSIFNSGIATISGQEITSRFQHLL
jgi:hypothetical protein